MVWFYANICPFYFLHVCVCVWESNMWLGSFVFKSMRFPSDPTHIKAPQSILFRHSAKNGSVLFVFFFLFGTWLDVKFESCGEEEEVLLATSYGCVAHKLEERKYEKVWERRESSRMLQISTQKLYSLGPTTYSCVSPEWCLFGGFGFSGTWNNAYVCGAHKLCRAWN